MSQPSSDPRWPEQPSLGTTCRSSARQFDREANGTLNLIRITALTCRCSARSEVFEACRLLEIESHVSVGAFAEVMVRCSSQLLGRRAVFFSPGIKDVTYDEAWLMRLVVSVRSRDRDSVEFLIRSRVPRHMQRTTRFLAHGLASG